MKYQTSNKIFSLLLVVFFIHSLSFATMQDMEILFLKKETLEKEEAFKLGINFHNYAEKEHDKLTQQQLYFKAFNCYLAAAEKGYMVAQFNLAKMYHEGLGIDQSDEKSINWYEKAAEQNDVDAKLNLAILYFKGGNDTKISYEKALEWYRKASENGSLEALCGLGIMYFNGWGVIKSDEEALKWFNKAAQRNYAPAQTNIGIVLAKQKNYTKAVKYFMLSANQGNADGQFSLGVMYENSLGVIQSYQECKKWYKKAARQGHVQAQLMLGIIYEFRIGINPSYKKAIKWYKKAAEHGNSQAQFNLAEHYLNGRGVEQSDKEAFQWYFAAANQGYSLSQCHLGVCYEKGLGTEPSYEQALKWYRKAAEKNQIEAYFNIGVLYENGRGIKQSYTQAKQYYEKAAEQGHTEAQFNFGMMQAKGLVGPPSRGEALKWYRKAAEQGFAPAQYNLATYLILQQDSSQLAEEATSWFFKAAEQGFAPAQYSLSVSYKRGEGVVKSYTESAKWCLRAAKQKYVNAQDSLGWKYCKGEGILKDEMKTILWWKNAIKQGRTELKELLELYESKKNSNLIEDKCTQTLYCLQDNSAEILFKEIMSDNKGSTIQNVEVLYKISAEKGNTKSQFKLSLMYKFGLSSIQDFSKSIDWLSEASQRGDVDASRVLGVTWGDNPEMFSNHSRKIIWCLNAFKFPKIEEIAKIINQCSREGTIWRAWLFKDYMNKVSYGRLLAKKLASPSIMRINNFQEVIDKEFSLGALHYFNEDIPKEAMKHLANSGALGDIFSQYLISQICEEGKHLLVRPELLEWCENIANNGNPEAQYSLGQAYKNGFGVEKNEAEAFKWYSSAANQKHAEAQFELGRLFLAGSEGVKKDKDIALTQYRLSADQGYPVALYTLGNFYVEGTELPEDLKQAIQYYTRAAEQGDENARDKLIELSRQGNEEATISLGNLYAEVMIERSPSTTDEEVFIWLGAASDRGNLKALYRLGRMYEYGWGTGKDEKAAFKYFKKGVSEYWYAPAQKAVAEMYREGRGGVEQSNFLAVKWYRQAAKQGDAGASSAIKDIANSENYAPALYTMGRAHEEGWGIAQDEDEALLQYEQSALQGYFKGQYKVAIKQLEGKAPFKGELAPLELVTLLSGEEARRNYVSFVGKKLDRKERKKLKRLQQDGSLEERLPEGGYYKAQHKLAELYETGQSIPFKRIEDQLGACREAIRLYEKAGEAIQRGKLVTLEPLGSSRKTLSHLQQFNDQEKFDLNHPGFKKFLEVYGLSEDKKPDSDFRNQLALVFDARKTFDKSTEHEIKKALRKILTFSENSKPAWGILTMLIALIRDFDSSRDSKSLAHLQEELRILYRKIDVLSPLWRFIPSASDIQSKPLKICKWMVYDPRVEIFNSCYSDFEKDSYEDSFRGSVEKILTIFDKLHIPGLAGEAAILSPQDLSQTRQHLLQLITHDNQANHRFKNRLVKIADIVQEKFEEGKLKRDIDLLTSLKIKLYVWAERGGGNQRDCLTGGEDELSQFYFDYIVDSKGGNASALAKEDWTLEMQLAVWLASLRKQLIDELVIEKDENKIHAVRHLEKKTRVALGLLGDAEKYADGLESTISSYYRSMTTEDIVREVMKQYTPKRMMSYITSQVNKLEKRNNEVSRSPFYEKLRRRLQFQHIREEVAPYGEFDHSLFQDEEWVLNYCTQNEFECYLLLKSTLKSEGTQTKTIQDWETIKGRACMKAGERMGQDFYNEDGQFTPKGTKTLLRGMKYLE